MFLENATNAEAAEATKGADMAKHTYGKQSNGPRASASTTGNVVEGNGASAGHSHIITDNKMKWLCQSNDNAANAEAAQANEGADMA